jgi:hypothetical protein
LWPHLLHHADVSYTRHLLPPCRLPLGQCGLREREREREREMERERERERDRERERRERERHIDHPPVLPG